MPPFAPTTDPAPDPHADLVAEIDRHTAALDGVRAVIAHLSDTLASGGSGRLFFPHLPEPAHPEDNPAADPRLYALVTTANRMRSELAGINGVLNPDLARRNFAYVTGAHR